MQMLKNLVLFILIVLFSFSKANAQNALAYMCDFSQGYSWESKNIDFKGKETKETMSFTLTVDSSSAGKIIGNAGAADVSIIDTIESTSFIEQTFSGNLAITTIFKQQTAQGNKGNKRQAVHSRHMNMMGTSIVSQYVGICDLKN